jgi:hypothetical protein
VLAPTSATVSRPSRSIASRSRQADAHETLAGGADEDPAERRVVAFERDVDEARRHGATCELVASAGPVARVERQRRAERVDDRVAIAVRACHARWTGERAES